MKAVRAPAVRIRPHNRRPARRSGRRRILVDSRTPMNFTMVAPVVRAMEGDPRVSFYFTATEAPWHVKHIYRAVPKARTIHPWRAALIKFDAYVASDFTWATLLHQTARVQVFHGVAGKYGFDAPDQSMRAWHRLFFINERRLRNFLASGAIDPDSPAIRLVGMPKVDCLVDDTYNRTQVLLSLGLDPALPSVLYAPTWSPASSLNTMGEEIARALTRMPVNLIVKLHDRSRDVRQQYSGAIDWVGRLTPLLPAGRGVIAPGHDISPYLVAADLMVTDHSSAGFEFLLRDRPIVRIHQPGLIELARIHLDYVSLLASVSHSVRQPAEVIAAVERGLAHPHLGSESRRHVAADLFYKPGSATERSVAELYNVIELEPPAATPVGAPARRAGEQWQRSA